MPKQRQGSVTWNKKRKAWVARLDWQDSGGRRHCRKRQVENKSAGNRLVKEWIDDLEEEGEEYLASDALTFKELADQYQAARLIPAEYREGKKVKGQRDWKAQRARLAKLTEYFGARRVREITYADLEEYRNGLLDAPVETRKRDGTVVKTRQRSIGAVHRMLALLRAVFTYGVQKERLKRNPFGKGEGLISMAQEVARERVLSTDEQRAILQACQAEERRHIYPLVLTAFDSGCRRGELLKLTWGDVDLDKGTLTVTAMNAKANRRRVIDLEPVTVAELRKLAEKNGRQADKSVFGIKKFTDAWTTALKVAGVVGARFHDCRATAICTWLLRGMSTPFAMARSGHNVPHVFMRYVRLAEDVRAKQRALLSEWELGASLQELAEPGREDAPGYVN